MSHSSDNDPALTGFDYQSSDFAEFTHQCLQIAKKLGASDAAAEIAESNGLSVTVRKGKLETVKKNKDKSLGITVYLNKRMGHASTNDFSLEAMETTVKAAYDIAKYTAEDQENGLPEASDIVTHCPDLDLFHDWSIDAPQATEIALQCEQSAFAVSNQITNSDGAGVDIGHSHFFSAHTHGLSRGYATSRHSIWTSVIAGTGEQMQADYWHDSMVCPADLMPAQDIGQKAAQRAISRLNSKKISSRTCRVLFENQLGAGIIGHFVQAVSGHALYKKNSFLVDSLHKPIFSNHIQLFEDPFVMRGKASVPFDSEGVVPKARWVVQNGRVQAYFLNTYTAKKLSKQTNTPFKSTANAGGAHNLFLTSSQTQTGDDLAEMLKKLDTGLYIVEVMGFGVNYTTGDYSRGASGFWVENGQIAYPVAEITIASTLQNMFAQILAVGSDAYTYGGKTSGSILFQEMQVAGT
ncbi:MAG: metallopeptidase TldD-related protein [Gammaproteobacteria bacterium]|nr:metallopeptidase TldD-related protein [Gammaproteobacteria bacterium]